MQVNALDHVNVITSDLERSCAFYTGLLGLERRDGPPPLTPQNAQWMYDHAGRAIVHGMPTAEWKAHHHTAATPEQLARMEESMAKNPQGH